MFTEQYTGLPMYWFLFPMEMPLSSWAKRPNVCLDSLVSHPLCCGTERGKWFSFLLKKKYSIETK